MSSRWTGFFIWALVAASAAFWSLKIFAATRPVPPGAQAPQAIAANGPMERLFGAVVVPTTATAAAAPESSRFKLVGVIAPPNGVAEGGYAVVSIDDAPARTWRVGSTLDGNTTLQTVSKRGAEFGPSGGPSSFSLQLPEPAAAETGSLQPATSQPDPSQLQQQVQQQQQQQQRQNAQQFAQPQFPGQGIAPNGMPNRGSVPRPIGRGGFQGANGVAPSRVAQPPDQTEAPPLQQ
jgi:general secretion pathway protein C